MSSAATRNWRERRDLITRHLSGLRLGQAAARCLDLAQRWAEALDEFRNASGCDRPRDRAFEVSEQHGDVLAFALHRGLGGDDLVGEVLGGVALRGFERLGRGARSADGKSALGTEFRSRRDECAAARATPLERRRALLAELRALAVIVLTSRTPWRGETMRPCGPIKPSAACNS